MYTLITIFYISLLAITGMILLKRREIKFAKCSPISIMGRSIDHIFEKAYAGVIFGIKSINKRTFTALAHWLAYHVLLRIRNIYIEIKHAFIMNPHGKRLIDAVRGRGEVRNHGASFYLRRISE